MRAIKLSLLNYQMLWFSFNFSVNTDIFKHKTVLKFVCGLATQFPITVNSFHHHS